VLQSAIRMMALTGALPALACSIRFEVVTSQGEAVPFEVIRLQDRMRKSELGALPPVGASPVTVTLPCSYYEYELQFDPDGPSPSVTRGTLEVDSNDISVYKIYNPRRSAGPVYYASRGLSTTRSLEGRVTGRRPVGVPLRVQLLSWYGTVEVEVVVDASGAFPTNRPLMGDHTLLVFAGTRFLHAQPVTFRLRELVQVTVPLDGKP